jgi:hypothetical protein
MHRLEQEQMADCQRCRCDKILTRHSPDTDDRPGLLDHLPPSRGLDLLWRQLCRQPRGVAAFARRVVQLAAR